MQEIGTENRFRLLAHKVDAVGGTPLVDSAPRFVDGLGRKDYYLGICTAEVGGGNGFVYAGYARENFGVGRDHHDFDIWMLRPDGLAKGEFYWLTHLAKRMLRMGIPVTYDYRKNQKPCAILGKTQFSVSAFS